MKKILSNKKLVTMLTLGAMLVLTTCTAFAAEQPNWGNISKPIVTLINSFLPYILSIVGALGVVYSVFLGVKYAKAEEPQEREKAKQSLKGAIIGFILIFVLALACKVGITQLSNWAGITGVNNGYGTTTEATESGK